MNSPYISNMIKDEARKQLIRKIDSSNIIDNIPSDKQYNPTIKNIPAYNENEYRTEFHKIVISSFDRDWYNNTVESPYNFSILLGATSSTSNSVVDKVYKNVSSIGVNNFILPNKKINNHYTSNCSFKPIAHPYLLLSFDSINFTSRGTNKYLNESMGVYTPIVPIYKVNTLDYLEFKNSSFNSKVFSPAPHGFLSQLDIKITNPLGSIVNNNNDVLTIDSIYINNYNYLTLSENDYLIVKTNTYFNNNDFTQGDRIKFKYYKYHDMSFEESYQFNQFINKDAGHIIMDVDKSSSDSINYDLIHIPISADISDSTGNISIDSWFSNFVMKTLGNTAISVNSGKLINMNMQSHIIVSIETLEKNNNILKITNLQ